MVNQTDSLAGLPPRTAIHSSPKIRRIVTQRGPPSGPPFFALTVVDMASRYKGSEPLTSKDSSEVVKVFQTIYKRSPLKWPQLLQVDPGREFMGSVTKEMENYKTTIRRGRTEIHRDQAIVERFNRTLAEHLVGHQYAVEMLLPSGQQSTG